MLLLLTLASCTVTDDLGATCGWDEALADGNDTFCPQPDAPERCAELAEGAALYAILCLHSMTDREILEVEFEQGMHCDSAVVILSEAEDCLEAMKDRTCPEAEGLPAVCNGVVVSG
ncbi:hypothetical protein LBMAG42_36530 [Deltaproteobacteria bacterium]|nr:hypothetical protein LBMAG42_36530 [Deltaproteobacteria bacterium]